MNILGISCFYHDSAACLVRYGHITAAAQEERFTRKKHDPRFPKNAIKYCLEESGINIEDVDYVVFYDKSFLTFERLLMSYLTVAPKGLRSWLEAMPLWLGQKLYIPKVVQRETGYKGDVLFTELEEKASEARTCFWLPMLEKKGVFLSRPETEWKCSSGLR